MSQAIANVMSALAHAQRVRPRVGGFPVLAEVMRRAGVTKNRWWLPSCQSIFHTELGPVLIQATPLVSGQLEVPRFDQQALVAALRADQEGQTTLPEFLARAWQAGCVRYEVDLIARTVSYYGWADDAYVEEYPEARLP